MEGHAFASRSRMPARGGLGRGVSRGLAEADGRGQWALDIPTPEQHKEILRFYEQGMRDGAISVNSTVGYMGYGTPTYEIFDLQKVAKKYERFFGGHTRFGPTESLPLNYTLGVREVVANAVALDGALPLICRRQAGCGQQGSQVISS